VNRDVLLSKLNFFNISINKINQIIYNKIYTPKNNKTNHNVNLDVLLSKLKFCGSHGKARLEIYFNYRAVVTWLVLYVVRVQDKIIRAGSNPLREGGTV
jgi:hypothetical protein